MSEDSAKVLLLAVHPADARRFLDEWPALDSPALKKVWVHSTVGARGLVAGALFVTPAARKHPKYAEARAELAPCFWAAQRVLPPQTRVRRPVEYRRVGPDMAPRYALPNPRGEGIQRAAELIRAAAPVGQVAAVVRDAMAAHVKPLLDKMQPASQVTVSRTLSIFPEAVEAAGLVVELPPAAASAVDDFEDQVDREAGRPARERRHKGSVVFDSGWASCSMCEWAPQKTAHVRTQREAVQAIRRAHNPNGEDLA